MKTYEDSRISFSYPKDFKLVRAKKKWGQYNLEKKLEKKKTILFVMQFVEDEETLADIKKDIQDFFSNDHDNMEYLGEISFGNNKGTGHVVIMNDFENNFVQKRYRYLFPISEGGLYVEVIGEKEFSIDEYKEILKSIKVK